MLPSGQLRTRRYAMLPSRAKGAPRFARGRAPPCSPRAAPARGRALSKVIMCGLMCGSLTVPAQAALGARRFGRASALTARLLATAPAPAPPADSGSDDGNLNVNAEAVAVARQVRRDANLLLREIASRSAEVRRSNKRLAQAVSQWVSTAMEQGTSADGGGGGGIGGDGGADAAATDSAAAPAEASASGASSDELPPSAGGDGARGSLAGLRFGGAGTLGAAALAAAGVAASAAVAWGSS